MADDFATHSNTPASISGSRMSHIPRLALVGLAFLGVAGCTTQVYQCETTLHSDGTVTRAVLQPLSETSEEIQHHKDWEVTRLTDDSVDVVNIRDVTVSDEDPSYFAAWGRFRSIDQVPEHFYKQSEHSSKSSRLSHAYNRSDFLLVTEHDWSESINEIVTLSDVHPASRELAEILIDIVEPALANGLGDSYETHGLVRWLRGDGTDWAIAIIDSVIQVAAASPSMSDTARESMLVEILDPICSMRGLSLTAPNGERLIDSDLNEAIESFAAKTIRENVRRVDGQPLEDTTIQAIFLWMTGQTPQSEEQESQELFKSLKAAAEEAIEQQFSSSDAFQSAIDRRMERIFGLYGQPIGQPMDFRFQMTMPGLIVETNGRLASNYEVIWAFDEGAIFPFGYAMRCKSLEFNRETQQRLLGRVALNDRRSMEQFVALLRDEPKLLDVLQQCIEEESLEKLQEIDVTTLGIEDDERLATFLQDAQKLRKIIQPAGAP